TGAGGSGQTPLRRSGGRPRCVVLGLFAVDEQLHPGNVGPEAGEQPPQARIVVAGGHDLVGVLLKSSQTAVAAVLDDDLETARGAQSRLEQPGRDPVAGLVIHDRPGGKSWGRKSPLAAGFALQAVAMHCAGLMRCKAAKGGEAFATPCPM